MKFLALTAILMTQIAQANIVRYLPMNTVYVLDATSKVKNKVMLLDHDEIKIVNGCIVQYRDRLFYSVDPATGKATRISLINHEDIEPISGCIVRYKQDNTVYMVEAATGRAYRAPFVKHNEISNQ